MSIKIKLYIRVNYMSSSNVLKISLWSLLVYARSCHGFC